MKKIALFVLAGAMLFATSGVSQAGDCNSCCPQKSCKLSLPKINLKSLFSMGCKSKCDPCCAAPTCAAPAAVPAPAEAAPAPKPPVELSPSAADQPKKK